MVARLSLSQSLIVALDVLACTIWTSPLLPTTSSPTLLPDASTLSPGTGSKLYPEHIRSHCKEGRGCLFIQSIYLVEGTSLF